MWRAIKKNIFIIITKRNPYYRQIVNYRHDCQYSITICHSVKSLDFVDKTTL